MSKNSFNFRLRMGFWEGELIVKALQKYKTKLPDEKIAKEDIIRHLNYQMQEAKKRNETAEREADK